MSQRPRVHSTVRVPADGGKSPNRYVPEITAEVRVVWPPRADRAAVLGALDRAHRDARRALEERLA